MEIPGPQPLLTALIKKMYCNCIFEDVFFMYYNCIYRAEITLNIKELVIDVDVKITDLLPFCSKVSFMAVECQNDFVHVGSSRSLYSREGPGAP